MTWKKENRMQASKLEKGGEGLLQAERLTDCAEIRGNLIKKEMQGGKQRRTVI